MAVCERLGDDQKRTTGAAGKGAEHGFCLNIVVGSTLHDLHTPIGLLGRGNQTWSVGRGVRIEQDTNLRQVRHKLMQ